MKVSNASRHVESRVPHQAHNAKIIASAKAFQVLSSNLYTDKPLAIVRELSANALDAHAAAGNEKVPFKVVLPSALRPELQIRDWGTGLSHEGILDLYMTYFGSNKDADNLLVGGYGVGSKTPFAYTDTFTVISRYQQMRSIYTAFKDDAGMPKIVLMAQAPTDQPNGLEVLMPVKPGDFSTFARAAQKALWYFPKGSVTLIGADLPAYVYDIKTEKFGVRAYNAQQYSVAPRGLRVIMGPIAYYVPWADVRSHDIAGVHRGGKAFTSLEQIDNIDLFADIGEFDVQISREALSFDRNTIKRLGVRLREVQTSLVAELIKKIEQEPTPWLRYARAREGAARLGVGGIPGVAKYLDLPAFDLADTPCEDARLGRIARRRTKYGITWASHFDSRFLPHSPDSPPVFIYLDERWPGKHPVRAFINSNAQWLASYADRIVIVQGAGIKARLERIVGTHNWVDFSDVHYKPKVHRKNKKAYRRKSSGKVLLSSLRYSRLSWSERKVEVSQLIPNECAYVALSNHALLDVSSRQTRAFGLAIKLHLLDGVTLVGIPRREAELIPAVASRIEHFNDLVFRRIYEKWNDSAFREQIVSSHAMQELLTYDDRRFMEMNLSGFQETATCNPGTLFADMVGAYEQLRFNMDTPLFLYRELFECYPATFPRLRLPEKEDLEFFSLFSRALDKYRLIGDYFQAYKQAYDQGRPFFFPLRGSQLDHYFSLLED